MIISLQELVVKQIITEDTNGRKVFRDSFSTQELLVNADNIVTVRSADSSVLERLAQTNFGTTPVSSVYLNRGGVNSTEVLVLGAPREIMKKLSQKVLLND